VLLAHQGDTNNRLQKTGRQLLEEPTNATDAEIEFCSRNVCGDGTVCDSLFFQRWTFLRDDMGISELYDRSSVQHVVACSLLEQSSPDEPVIETFPSLVFLVEELYGENYQEIDIFGSSAMTVAMVCVVLGAGSLLAIITTCVQRFWWKQLRDRISPSAFCEIGSVYWFALPGGSWIGLLVFGCTVALQIAIFFYSLSCIVSLTAYTISPLTGAFSLLNYIPGAVVLFVYLMKDIVMSLRIIIRGGATKSIRIVFTGCTMLMITMAAVATTFFYFVMSAPPRSESLTSAVNAIIVNDIDEKVFEMLRCVRPQWVELQRAQYLQRVEAERQISEAETRTPGDKCYWLGVCFPILAIIGVLWLILCNLL
jgi:hypothetical protein